MVFFRACVEFMWTQDPEVLKSSQSQKKSYHHHHRRSRFFSIFADADMNGLVMWELQELEPSQHSRDRTPAYGDH